MSVTVENLEKSMAKLTIEVEADEFEKAVQSAFLKQRNKISIPGFRKGKATRKMVEKIYGEKIFFEDAANSIIPDAYEKAAKESELNIVSQPEIDVVTIEKNEPFVFTATVAVMPEVTLGTYKGIEVEKKEATVTEEEVDAKINKERELNSTMTTVEGRAAQDGDTLVIDFDGYVDGEQFEGGYAENHSLELGSHTFIDGFEEQLVGTNAGDNVEVNVTFPDDYHEESLQGKPALFKVSVNEIKTKELPELDDEFAQDVSEFDTFEEYKADVEKQLLAEKEDRLKGEKEDEIIQKIIEDSEMEIPEPMVKTQTRSMLREFEQRIQAQGLSLEQYMQFTGMTPAALEDELKPQAMKNIQSRLVLEAIVKAEDIQVSDEELDKEFERLAEMYKMKVDEFKDIAPESEKENISMGLAIQKAVELVVNESVEK